MDKHGHPSSSNPQSTIHYPLSTVHYEWLFPLVTGAFFVLIGSFPYIYGYLHAPPGTHFMGAVGRGALHSHGYLMFARQAQEGCNLFENKLTPEPLPRTYFNPEWWAFGKLARWTGLSLEAVSHVHRAIAVFLMVIAVYSIVSQCLGTVFQRRVAFSLIIFGSGFGWVFWAASQCYMRYFPFFERLRHMVHPSGPGGPPMPFELPRDVTGVTIAGYLVNKPHFTLWFALLILSFAYLIRAERIGRRGAFAVSGLWAFAGCMSRAFGLRELYPAYALLPLLLNRREGRWNWARVWNYAVPGIIVFPTVLYYVYLMLTKTLGDAKLDAPAGTFLEYAVWYGIPFVCLFYYFPGIHRLERLRPELLIPGVWLLIAYVVAQMYPWVRTGEESSMVAFCVVPSIFLVAGPLERLFARLGPNAPRRLMAAGLIVACCPTNAVVYGRMFTALDHDPQLYYLDNDLYAAMKWLDANTSRDDLVLSGPITCAFIPMVSGNKTFTGHDLLTTKRREKDTLADRFFKARGEDPYKRSVVKNFGVKYVLFGPNERSPGAAVFSDHRWLKLVHTEGQTAIYQVAMQ